MTQEPQSLYSQANKHCEARQWNEAAKLYRQFLDHEPDHEWVLNNLGFALNQLKRRAEAEACLRQALRINPNNLRVLHNLVMVLEGTDDRFAAIDIRRMIAHKEPLAEENLFALANLLQAAGLSDEACHYYQRAIALQPEKLVFRSNLLLASNYSDTLAESDVALEHFRHGQAWLNVLPETAFSPTVAEESQRLRIGYLTSDFAHHPVGKICSYLFSKHDRSRVEIIGFSDRTSRDAWTQRVRAQTDHWLDTGHLSDTELLQIMRQAGLHVLIELNGHTGGRNRLGVLAQRVAPVQASFLGYPNTTGLQAIDYYITDRFCSPGDITERYYAEKIIRLKSGCLCFDPDMAKPDQTESPQLKNGYLTFGVFNNPAKASPSALTAWAAILKQVPDSRLIVKYGGKFKSNWLKNRWLGIFAEHNVSTKRVEFLPADPTLEGHYQRLASVDLALDSFPYQGTTTTLECLSAGVPVLTRAGSTYCRRASSAIMLRLGLKELVTYSDQDYVDRAVELADSPNQLQNLRKTIATDFPTSPICDATEFVQELEDTLLKVVEAKGFHVDFSSTTSSQEIDPLIVACTGMPRSGSTWAFNVSRRLLETAFGEDAVRAAYKEGARGGNALTTALNDNIHQVLKFHYPDETAMTAIASGRVKNVCTVRNPLTAVASFRDMFGGNIDQIATRIRHSLEAADTWKQDCDSTLFIQFDDLTGRSREQVNRLADFLGLQLTDEQIDAVDQQTNLAAVRKKTQDAATLGENLKREGTSAYDPDTQYHVGHAQKAASRDWREELSEEDQEIATRILQPWL